MGLAIYVGKKEYYSGSYARIHLLRRFALKQEGFKVDNVPSVNLPEDESIMFSALVNHSDCDGGYYPSSFLTTAKRLPADWNNKVMWNTTEELFGDLGILMRDYNLLDKDCQDQLLSLVSACIESLRENELIEFK